MEFRLVLSGGIVQKGYVGYLIFCLKIDLRNTNLLRKNPINNNDQQHKNLAHSAEFRMSLKVFKDWTAIKVSKTILVKINRCQNYLQM